MAAEYGIEYAARKLNHSSTKVTKDHYIVPEDKELERENDYGRSNIATLRKPSKTMPVLLWQRNEKLIGRAAAILDKEFWSFG